MNSRLLPTLIVAFALAVLGTACGDDEPVPVKPAAKPRAAAPQPRPAQPTAVEPKSLAEQLAEEVDLPGFYPSDAPVYPSAKLNTAALQPGGRASTVFSTGDSQAEVTSFLDSALPGSGWDEIQTLEIADGVIIQASKSWRKISVLVSPLEAENKTLIAVSVDREN